MKPVMLCIMDGWGECAETGHNAVALARTPVFDRLRDMWPSGTMSASGRDVGLPDGQMGNSEVGHMNLGAGRVVLQDLPRINQAIGNGMLETNTELRTLITTLLKSGGRCHLIGLLSPGGVHSHQDHIAALARTIAGAGVPILIHAVLDGRDTAPMSARDCITDFEHQIGPGCRIATVIGRFYAMDRDKRWSRVITAWRAMVRGEAEPAMSADAAVAEAYARGETDEFVTPAIIGDYQGMADGDGLVMANFRSDRARQMLTSLVDPAFDAFPRECRPDFAAYLGMVSYSGELDKYFRMLFPPQTLYDTLGEVVARAGLRQLRIAETEKYPHVTFFLNGGRETIFAGEERIFVPSPKVKTYDMQPEMSADAVTNHLVEAILGQQFDLIVANYANPDMVGHTGDLDAAIAAVETVDCCVGRVAAALEQVGGTMFLTADHGNCETMTDPTTGNPHTAHTTNPVPTVLAGAPGHVAGLASGRLGDVAPTLLELMGVPVPSSMTGQSLLQLKGGADPEILAAG